MKVMQSLLAAAALAFSASVSAQLAPLPGQWTPPAPTPEEPVAVEPVVDEPVAPAEEPVVVVEPTVEEPVAEAPTQEPQPASGPRAQAVESLNKNIEKNPDNQGLRNALSQMDRPLGSSVERVERAARFERAEIARAHRPERAGKK